MGGGFLWLLAAIWAVNAMLALFMGEAVGADAILAAIFLCGATLHDAIRERK